MSIKVYVKDKAVIAFPDEESATYWVEKNPDIYDGDLKNIQFFSDEPMEDLIVAKEEVTERFNCMGCGASLKFHRHPAQTYMSVHCPLCGTTHGITAPDVSSPRKSGDED